MNIHDKAHELAKGLQQSQEYQEFLAMKQKLESDAHAQKMVRDFIAKKIEVEYEILAGKPEDKEKTDQLQRLYDVLSYNATARDFLHAQMRFQQVMSDVYKIIGDGVAEGLDFLAQE